MMDIIRFLLHVSLGTAVITAIIACIGLLLFSLGIAIEDLIDCLFGMEDEDA